MTLYCGIDLHSTNSVVTVLNEREEIVYEKRLPNDLALICSALGPYREALAGCVVESTYNWYWLVDGLMDSGFTVKLAHPGAIRQYDGLKHGNDQSDARHLAQLLRQGILPSGHIYPREERALRDLLRRRLLLVHQRKLAKSHLMVARKAAANKLARACYHRLKNHGPFDIERAFG